jgi:membrane-associated phospholipid phosphatase
LAWVARRHGLGVELVVVVAVYLVYDASRGLVGGGSALAVHHAHQVVSMEQRLHVSWERSVQHGAAEIPGVPRLFAWGYMSLHLGATGLTLLWLHRRRPSAYATVRLALIIASFGALVGFIVFPTAPPRLAGVGIIDTISDGTVNLGSSALHSIYNPYAAMPSLHLAYAGLVGVSLWRLARPRAIRALGLVYPLWVAAEVIATGNHFVLDVLAGAGVAAAALVVAQAAVAWADRREPLAAIARLPTPKTAPAAARSA